MGFHTNHTHHVMIMNKTQHAVLQNRGLNVKTDERKILYSSFRPLYLCTFASDKSCLTEIHRKLQNLRLLPSHYLSLWEKLISRLFLIYSYSNIVFRQNRRPFLSRRVRTRMVAGPDAGTMPGRGRRDLGRSERGTPQRMSSDESP